jgi:hypothetical protein
MMLCFCHLYTLKFLLLPAANSKVQKLYDVMWLPPFMSMLLVCSFSRDQLLGHDHRQCGNLTSCQMSWIIKPMLH